jgi:hypothetical protein
MNISEQNEQKLKYSELKLIYQKAIDLRLQGFPHAVIARTLARAGYKVTEHTVRVWFTKNGKCYYAFSDIKLLRIREFEERLEERDQLIKAATTDALVVIGIILDEALNR